MMGTLRQLHDVLCHDRSAWFEGDIFSGLRHSPYAVRSFEFALADGAIDCSRDFRLDQSYASRFQSVVNSADQEMSELCLFDAKGTVGFGAGYQEVKTNELQGKLVAFFLNIAAADMEYIDVVPNVHQTAAPLVLDGEHLEDGGRQLAANVSRQSRLPATAYGLLDQCSTPYRMPIRLLPEALRRVRQRIRHGEVYVNPWNGLAFPEWDPLTTRDIRWLQPAEGTMSYTAYECVTNIMRHFAYRRSLIFDFVELQPRLADFKLSGYLIQHKVDTQPRARQSVFSQVSVTRDSGSGSLRYYFDSLERFDFFFYQFETSELPVQRLFFFIPESEIPDSLYISREKRTSFERFDKFRREMDDGLEWINEIEKIVLAFPNPRRPGQRPPRRSASPDPAPIDDARQALPAHAHAPASHGRKDYARIMRERHRLFFYSIMDQCARRGCGLLIVLATNHPSADFGFCPYVWSDAEKRVWQRAGRPPRVAHSLPSVMPVVPIYYYAHHRQCWFPGPSMTAAQFRRLESCSNGRLIIWDLGGSDTGGAHHLAVVPTEDIVIADKQREIFHNNLSLKRAGGRAKTTPTVSSMLKTGLFASQYCLGSGPTAYLDTAWGPIWELLTRFCSTSTFEHPTGFIRDPAAHRCTLLDLHARLHQHYLIELQTSSLDFDDEDDTSPV